MERPLTLLDRLHVAEPCTVPWDGMAGSDKARFCNQCNKHVHDLSAMVRAEAESFCRQNPTACIRFTRNELGKTLTRDSARPGWLRRLAFVVPAWLGLSAGVGCGTRDTCTMGKPPTPLPIVVSENEDDIRSAKDAAKDPSTLIGKPLDEVLRRLGVQITQDTLWSLGGATFEDVSGKTRGFRIRSSAGDLVWVYVPAPDNQYISMDWDKGKKELVTGIAIQRQLFPGWIITGKVDPDLHRT
ncbi:MAG TPA: hypothetical protein VGJ05_15635 [Fimbriiglobus sp.]|jgi:hypothetical protein